MTTADLNGLYTQYFLPFSLKLLMALVIFLVGQWAARLLSGLVGTLMTRAKMNPALVSFGRHMTYFALWVLVAIAALNKLGVETTSFVALVGAAGLAVGLALQGALSNFAAGVMILVFEPFGIGDMIEAGGASGKVVEIQMFSTIIIADDGRTVIVPNSKITADKIVVNKKA
jgi:small conductance mechanosensitive channel